MFPLVDRTLVHSVCSEMELLTYSVRDVEFKLWRGRDYIFNVEHGFRFLFFNSFKKMLEKRFFVIRNFYVIVLKKTKSNKAPLESCVVDKSYYDCNDDILLLK